MRFNFLKKIIILLTMLCVVSVNAYSKSFSLRINNPNSNVELNTNMNHENMNHENISINNKKSCNMSKACADCKKGACLSTNCSKCQSCSSLNIIPQYIATSIYESLNQSKLTFNAIKIKPIHYSIYIPPE